MKVLMQNRVDAFKNIGGDTVQMLKTKEELEKLGVEVEISLELEPNLEKYDIVHLFNISRVNETWIQCLNAKKQKKKIIVSTIYHSKEELREYEKNALMGFIKFVRNIFKNENTIELIKTFLRTLSYKKGFKSVIKQLVIGYRKQQEDVLEYSNIILPNSNKELDVLCNELNIEKDKIDYMIVPNGVEVVIDNNNISNNYIYKDFIFCAGRIEPLKNQIGLMSAMKDTNEKIVFVGGINKKHKKYYKKFMKLVNENENFYYLGLVNRDQMCELYKLAKVTVLPSWFETTGLTGIESIYAGTPAVVTDRGYTKEYYSDYVQYCNPLNIDSIRNAIELASENAINKELVDLIEEKFNWSNAAEVTLSAYRKLYDNN